MASLVSILAYASDRWQVPSELLDREIIPMSGDRAFACPEIVIPVLRQQMRAEIKRRLAQ